MPVLLFPCAVLLRDGGTCLLGNRTLNHHSPLGDEHPVPCASILIHFRVSLRRFFLYGLPSLLDGPFCDNVDKSSLCDEHTHSNSLIHVDFSCLTLRPVSTPSPPFPSRTRVSTYILPATSLLITEVALSNCPLLNSRHHL